MNNRVVANGTPLDTRLDNIAHAARRAGYDPALFGYTDQGVDPRTRRRSRRSAPVDVRGRAARLRSRARHERLAVAVAALAEQPRLRLRRSDRGARVRARTSRRTVDVDVPHRRLPRLARTTRPGRGSPISRTCDRTLRTARRASSRRCTTRPRAPRRCRSRQSSSPVRRAVEEPDRGGTRRPGRRRAHASPVLRHDQRGRCPAGSSVGGAGDTRRMGQHRHRRHRRSRRAARRSGPDPEVPASTNRATPSWASSAIRASTTSGSSTSSPRTSTSCRRCAMRWASPCRRNATATR